VINKKEYEIKKSGGHRFYFLAAQQDKTSNLLKCMETTYCKFGDYNSINKCFYGKLKYVDWAM
jgi:ribosome-interacting GTPase 1